MTIEGRISHISAPEQGQSAKGEWSKLTIVLETEGQYPKNIALTAWNKLTNLPFKIGTFITAHIDISSREYNGRWYTEVKAWKVEGLEQQSQPSAPKPASVEDEPSDQGQNDLPF